MKFYIMLFIPIFLLGCGFFKTSERRELTKITELNDGYFSTIISLKRVSSGWNVWIGDPYKSDEIIEKNKGLKNKILTLKLKNINDFEIWVWTQNGEVKMPPSGEIIYFNGTFDTLLTATKPIVYSSVPKSNYKYNLSIQFEDKNVKIEYPIPIIAAWSDCL